jgi:SAM-dependent methyltransferase
MKLSDIVAYLNLLDSVDVDQETGVAVRKLNAVLHMVTNHDLQIDSSASQLDIAFESVKSSIQLFANTLVQLKVKLHNEVARQEPEYLSQSLQIFTNEMVFENNNYILNRRLGIDHETNTQLRSRLRNLTDWRLPGLIFRPGLESFVQDLVPMDPLYLVDQHMDLLKPCANKFTPEYQQRLREYVINDRLPGPVLDALPNNQFGLVFAYNYFNYKPIEIIRKYFDELVLKLRPGGALIMTYNNCDQAHGVGLAEHAWMLYTPKRLIMQHAAAAGLEYISDSDGPGDVSWIEFARPGKLETIRGGQSLAKIIAQAA